MRQKFPPYIALFDIGCFVDQLEEQSDHGAVFYAQQEVGGDEIEFLAKTSDGIAILGTTSLALKELAKLQRWLETLAISPEPPEA